MADQPPPPEPQAPKPKRRRVGKKAKKVGKKAVHLTGREYLPMGFTIAFWGLTALAVGHADAARLLAATVLMRASYMLSQMNTMSAVRRRWHQAKPVRKQAVRKSAMVQVGVFAAMATQIALLFLLLMSIHQPLVAKMLAIVSIGLPARLLRTVDLRSQTLLFRLYTTGSMLAAGGIVWLLGGGPLDYALAFGIREYFATAIIRFTQQEVMASRRPTDEPLEFAEIARNTVVTSRRMITYRLTKNLLAIFGPFGNFAARTGRGLKYHSRLEPYMPHKRNGFALFAFITTAIAVVLAMRSGKPLAMVAGAGAMQLSALALNVLLWWRYLPVRDDPALAVEDDDDD